MRTIEQEGPRALGDGERGGNLALARQATLAEAEPRGPSRLDFTQPIDIENIRPSPGNSQLYRPVNPRDPDIVALAESIGEFGVRESPDDLAQVREELADIFCYALSFANALDLDIAAAVADKLVKNARKYPADRFRGQFR